ncbi:dihydroxyacetone kinase phosphoryl donor subunit DhaM [Geosporobacter ferrireducens]|uniref:phosphoenolpyruvate--glycerone phosphotransferase n=1 Tax=Geosporobacter ferrireducens TaxID=1424294 RepID=A0A1D8GK46_9FIRM|nr:dihydroxyacetone kinase phosphoryl donor subunit DhaM [Geosporobacter ferrireducens]AOT71287.1 dihydroxyacetone kinase [Geosporobacter ferrireducens]MTI58101.1 PTS-dependent dihydroxyacetone kinase phosphotransferase subunit DhaM [Geosporobacter ferrireducens]
MLGLVIVSHSEKVAQGIKDIAEQMNNGMVRIIEAGGADEGRIGTNPLKIQAAIEAAYDQGPVLIFADLGSAIMNAELAIDLVDDQIKKQITIVNAPLVEGVIAAVIQATITDDVEDIIQTAIASKDLNKI